MGRVAVTGRRNGVIFRYADGGWTDIGTVRREQLGPNRWRAFASFETYCEATTRDAAIRMLLRKLGIDPREYVATAPQSPAAAVQPATGTPTTPSTDDAAEDD